jgi:hypothetical protein
MLVNGIDGHWYLTALLGELPKAEPSKTSRAYCPGD